MTELLLGTAQLGQGYGVTNAVGRIPDPDAVELLEAALDSGIRRFDTAAVYDDAEERLGALMPAADLAYVTKFELRADEEPTADRLFAASLRRLRVDTVDGVLTRGIESLGADRAATAARILAAARDAGSVRRFGASVYDVEELALAAELLPGMAIVQVPGNAVDLRLLDSPLLAELRAGGVEVHVRSAFLQGLLLSAAADLPARFAALAPRLAALDDAAVAAGVSRLVLLLAALRRHPQVDAVVVGATGAGELREIAQAWSDAEGVTPPALEPLPVELADPRHWTKPAL